MCVGIVYVHLSLGIVVASFPRSPAHTMTPEGRHYVLCKMAQCLHTACIHPPVYCRTSPDDSPYVISCRAVQLAAVLSCRKRSLHVARQVLLHRIQVRHEVNQAPSGALESLGFWGWWPAAVGQPALHSAAWVLSSSLLAANSGGYSARKCFRLLVIGTCDCGSHIHGGM